MKNKEDEQRAFRVEEKKADMVLHTSAPRLCFFFH